jgi:hypothetical protein
MFLNSVILIKMFHLQWAIKCAEVKHDFMYLIDQYGKQVVEHSI